MCRLPLEGLRAVPSSKPAAGGSSSQAGQQYDDEFLQYTYKVVPCDKTWRHDYATCPFAHAGESSERRHPSAYLPFMCGSTQHSTDLKEKCPFGTACKYAHGHFELWLHPGRFRTKMCSLGANCKRPVCFFAHSEQELRTTPYSKLDTAASVAAQQLADLGQELEVGASLLGNSCSSIAGDHSRARPSSSIASPGSSECGAGTKRSVAGSSSNSPSNSLSVDEAAALATLTASMAALNSAPLLDVGGMVRLNNGAYLAATAAMEASLSGSADMSMSGSAGLWCPAAAAAAAAGVLQQPAAATAMAGYSAGPFLQQQVSMLDPQLLAGAAAAAPSGDAWLMPPVAAGQWPAVSAAAAARSMLVQQQRAYALSTAQPAAPCTRGLAPGIPIPNLMPAALDQWLPLDGLQAKGGSCYPLQAGLCAPESVGCSMVQRQHQQAAAEGSQQTMQQFLNEQAMQQLLGLLDAQVAH